MTRKKKFDEFEEYLVLDKLKELDSFIKLRLKMLSASDICKVIESNCGSISWNCVNENLKRMQEQGHIKKKNGRWMIDKEGETYLKDLKQRLRIKGEHHKKEYIKHNKVLGE